MRRVIPVPMPLRLGALLAIVAVPVTAGTWSVLATSVSGDWGGEVETDRQSTALRYAWGRSVRLRAEIEALRVQTAGDVVSQTPFGPVVTGRGPGPPPGGGKGNGNGDTGPGPGGPPGGAAPGVAPAAAVDQEAQELGWHGGLGDLRLSASRTLVGDTARRFRLDVEVDVKVPTADADDRLGTGEWDYRLGGAAEYELWVGRIFGGVGWNRLGDPSWADLSDVLDGHAGFESDPLAGGLVIAAWLAANQEVLAGAGDRAAVGLGLRGGGRLAWQAQLTTGLGGSAEDVALSLAVNLRGGPAATRPGPI